MHIETATMMKSQLRAQNFYLKPSVRKKKTHTLFSRMLRELPSYEDEDKFSVDDLRRFCAQRKLECGPKVRRSAVIKILEAADEAATFPQFLELPPELRNRVYSMHFDTFPVLEHPTTPPIARASRQLRQENLLLFYQSCNLYFQACHVSFLANCDVAGPELEHLILTREASSTLKTFHRLPAEYLGNIRKLCIVGAVAPSGDWNPERRGYTEWHVELAARANRVKMSVGKPLCAPNELPN